MKRPLILSILILSGLIRLSGQTVTIGTGTNAQQMPFGMWYAYERSASLYLYSQIGTYGLITNLGWYVSTADPHICPIKIYLKNTTSTNLSSAVAWSSLISGATLVYNSSVNFPVTGWQTIDISDYTYTASNLLVLCETNYGGVGAVTYPTFRYSTSTSMHRYYQGDNPPTNTGTLSNNRPNIQITYTSLGSPVPPSGFMATASGTTTIGLAWTKNSANDNVMVAYNTVNTFGTPSGSYTAGSAITGGGTVIYNGSGTSYTHNSGLSPATTYYYKAWSVHAPTPTYSSGVSSNANTYCTANSIFPSVADFEGSAFPPVCWSLGPVPWQRTTAASGYGTGTASVKADFFNISSGSIELISDQFDITALNNPAVTFDHAYATYTTQVDTLKLFYSTDNGSSYTLLQTWLGGVSGPLNTGGTSTAAFVPTSSQWASKTCSLPAGTNKLLFRGGSLNGNNLYLDNITVGEGCDTPTGLTATNVAQSSADISWTSLAAEWDLIWGDAGFNPATAGTLISSVTSQPYTLGSLQSGHSYDVYVRTSCGNYSGSWSGPVNFSTGCPAISLPYTENLDACTPPSTGCIAVTNNNGDSYAWATSATYPRSSPNCMRIDKNSALAMNDWFFTPVVTLSGGVSYVINFYYRSSSNSTNTEKLEIKASTTPGVSGICSGQLWYNASIQTTTYRQGTAIYTPASPGDYYIGWHGYSDANKNYLCVDDITIHSNIIWNGSNSTNWSDSLNWTPTVVPRSMLDAVLPGYTTPPANFPVISTTGQACNNLTLQENQTLTFSAGSIFTVNGDITIKPGAMLTINPTGKLTVNGDLLIESGGVLENNGTIVLKGDLINQN